MSILDIDKPVKRTRREIFTDERRELSEQDLIIESLYEQKISNTKLEAIRSNLSTIVWVIAIGITLAILGVLMRI